MTRKGKIFWKTALVLLLLAAAGTVALHVALTLHFTRIIRQSVVPRAQKAFGVDVKVADVAIGNPPGFEGPAMLSTDSLKLDMNLLALGDRVVNIAEARVDDVRITVIRNAEGDVNVMVVEDKLKAATRRSSRPPSPPAERTPPAPEPEAPAPSPRVPKIATGDIRISGRLEYIDYAVSKEPFRLAFKVLIETENVSTVYRPDGQWGKVRVTGCLADDPKLFRFDLSGTVAPLTDPGQPTFQAVAKVAEMDGARIEPFTRRLGYTADSLAIVMPLRCNNGKLDREESRLTLVAKNPRPLKPKKGKSLPLPPEVSVSAVLSGPLTRPNCDFFAGLVQSGFDNAAALFKLLEAELQKRPKAPPQTAEPTDEVIKARDEKAAQKQKELEGLLGQ